MPSSVKDALEARERNYSDRIERRRCDLISKIDEALLDASTKRPAEFLACAEDAQFLQETYEGLGFVVSLKKMADPRSMNVQVWYPPDAMVPTL